MNQAPLKYRFADFTLENYERLLRLAKEHFTFVKFNELETAKTKSIVLRHDVEFSVPIALKMAKLEHDLGIQASYFIQVHGDFYNILEKKAFETVLQIQSLGHEIGLHFDAHFWDIKNEDQLENKMLLDKAIFEDYFNIIPKSFSFHNTNDFVLSFEKEKYAGMINVYAKKFKNVIGYCSDSTGYWRYEVLEERLEEATDDFLQVLIHDGMWQKEVLPPRRRVYKVIDDHAAFMKRSYDETLKRFGAKNIDWEGEIS